MKIKIVRLPQDYNGAYHLDVHLDVYTTIAYRGPATSYEKAIDHVLQTIGRAAAEVRANEDHR